jgi:hypothetical protein
MAIDQHRGGIHVVRWNERLSHVDAPGRADRELVIRYRVGARVVYVCRGYKMPAPM